MKLLSINIFTDTIASFEDKCFADKRWEDASTVGLGQRGRLLQLLDIVYIDDVKIGKF